MRQQLLFVNACIREESRTRDLCEAFIQEYVKSADCESESVDLGEKNLIPMDLKRLAVRDRALAEGDFDDAMFEEAKRFRDADIVVMGAPYWDLSFPAILKVYLENIVVNGLTFCYTKEGIPVSLCKPKKMVYITTSGGYIGDFDSGEAYLKDLSGILNAKPFCIRRAEGLDIKGNNAEEILAEARKEIIKLCKELEE